MIFPHRRDGLVDGIDTLSRPKIGSGTRWPECGEFVATVRPERNHHRNTRESTHADREGPLERVLSPHGRPHYATTTAGAQKISDVRQIRLWRSGQILRPVTFETLRNDPSELRAGQARGMKTVQAIFPLRKVGAGSIRTGGTR
jgi:hypothetical protein